MQNTTEQQPSDGQAKAKPQVITNWAWTCTQGRSPNAGNWTLRRPSRLETWDPWKLLDQVEAWVQAGIQVYSCYEAGACGYWFHRELLKRGAVNFVVAPRPLQNQRAKGQKTDRLDARELLDSLDSYLRANRDAVTVVAVA